MKTYLISGIGADYRLFTHITLPEGYETAYIHWIPPQKEESLPSYAHRLASQIDHSEPFVLIGFSLGGIMAIEIAKAFPPICTIIISSVPISASLPPYYTLAQRLQLTKIASPTLMKLLASVKHLLTMRSRDNWKIMREVIWSGDDQFIAWAMDAVLKWENDIIPQPFYHIHGSRDEIFPISRIKPTYIIPKGGHTLIMNHPEAINALLQKILLTPIPPIPIPKPDTRLIETGRSPLQG
jgi:pimeloyl-ACP methyl ester carboxylesterase